MKKKLLLSSLALLPLALWAQIQSDGRFLQGGIYYRLNNETMTASVTPVTPAGSPQLTGDIVIPETITTEEDKTYVVDEIEERAFNAAKITSFACDSITNLCIPASLTDIRWGAFAGCKWLTDITVEAQNPVYESIEGFPAIIGKDTGDTGAGLRHTALY